MAIAFVRTIILYLLVVAGIRLLGKHQVGELEPIEFVLALLIADLASVPMQNNGIPLVAGVVPIVTLLCLSMVLSVLTMKCPRLRGLLSGRPSLLIANGKIDQREMRRNRFTVDELLEELRLQGCESPAMVRYAVLETNGQVSVLPYAVHRPPNAADLDLTPADPGLPVVLVSDGRLQRSALKERGLDEVWLSRQLKSHKLSSYKEVFLMTVDDENKVLVIPKEI